MSTTGYTKDRFPSLQGEIFDCPICLEVVRQPKQCSSCGNLYCGPCIDDWRKKNATCPSRCTGNTIAPMAARALINIYGELDIKCENCSKVVKMGDLPSHEEKCGRTGCYNSDVCDGYENKKIIASKPVCSDKCKLLLDLINTGGNTKQMYNTLKKFSPTLATTTSTSKVNLQWNHRQCGLSLNFNADYSSVFLKQQPYIFRSAVTTQGFNGGRHYWEIHADSRTQNELKIGVTSQPLFDFNTAFCDHKFGFAYYGLAQLRHGSNATGPQYGKRFKKTGVLGAYLNMDKGTLSFSLNGQDLGIAYCDKDLTRGPLFPSVALLHCSGCIIKGELPIPKIFESQ